MSDPTRMTAAALADALASGDSDLALVSQPAGDAAAARKRSAVRHRSGYQPAGERGRGPARGGGRAMQGAGDRQRSAEKARAEGYAVEVPPTGYFVIADAAPLGVEDALAWCRTLPEEAGVAGVPVQAFCSDPDQARSLVRFGFCKTEDVIAEGIERLQGWADARG